MKKYSLIPVMLLFSSLLFGQGIYNNGGKIVIGTGVTLTVSGSAGNYRNETGGLLNLSGTIKLEGNLTNNAAADVIGTAGAGSKVELNGTAAQTIGGTTNSTFNFPDLVVNNSSGVTFQKNASVTGALSLTNGLVDIGNNNFALGAAATVAGSPSASSMIVATGSGQVQKAWTAAGSFTFPVGDNTGTTEYSPVTLSFNSGTFASGAITGLSLSNSKYLPSAALNRYWTLGQTGITGFSGNAVFQYVPADVTGTESNMKSARVDPPPVTNFSAANVTLHQLSALGITSLGTFTGGPSIVEPVATNSQTICYNTIPTALSATAASGGTESFTYQWQISTDNSNWSDIVGETGLTFAPGLLAVITYYRIVATDAIWGTATSNVVTITVNPNATIALSSTIGTIAQSRCINTALTNITYSIGGGGTGAGVTGLPAGITGNYLSGVFTISGTPSVSGTFPYTVTTTGICSQTTANGTITVNPNATIVLSSAAGTIAQTRCINTALTNITYSIGGGGTGAGVTGLPAGVTGNYLAGVFTISGTPLVAGTFPYTVTTTGTCSQTTAIGTITVNDLPAIAGTIIGSATFTPGTSGVAYSVGAIANATGYTWNYTGTGVTINGTGNSITIDFAVGATSGTLSVKGTNSCGEGLASTLGLTTSSKFLNVKVYLEGPYIGSGVMNTTLKTNSLIPLAHPYSGAPWNVAAAPASSIPAGVVDWILVELRDATSPAAALSSTTLAGWPKAFFLKANGSIVDLDGASLPNIGNPTVTNNLYVIVRHRSHLAIMSATGATLNSGVYSYDFTTALSRAYGGGAGYKQVETGVFGMVVGDINHDGNIFVTDYNVWATNFGLINGYFNSDLNMDSNVFVTDYNKWATNFGSTVSTQLKSTLVHSKYFSNVPE